MTSDFEDRRSPSMVYVGMESMTLARNICNCNASARSSRVCTLISAVSRETKNRLHQIHDLNDVDQFIELFHDSSLDDPLVS